MIIPFLFDLSFSNNYFLWFMKQIFSASFATPRDKSFFALLIFPFGVFRVFRG